MYRYQILKQDGTSITLAKDQLWSNDFRQLKALQIAEKAGVRTSKEMAGFWESAGLNKIATESYWKEWKETHFVDKDEDSSDEEGDESD